MFSQLSSTARAATYYLLSLGMCIALAVTMPDGEKAAVLAMLTPTLAVLIMQLVVTRDGWRRGGWTSLGLGRLGRSLWPIAILLPVTVLLASEAAVGLTGLTSWHLPSSEYVGGLPIELPIMLIFCLAEEIGWRGYLSPLLAADGRRFPHLRTGFLHAIWHLPLVFLASNAYLTDGNKWIIVPVFVALLTCSGPVYGWMRQVTGSVYPAMLLHASFNLMTGLIAVTVTTSNPDTVAALGREGGIITLAALGVAALWVSSRPRPLVDPSVAAAALIKARSSASHHRSDADLLPVA